MNGLEEAIASIPLWFRAVLGLCLGSAAIVGLLCDTAKVEQKSND